MATLQETYENELSEMGLQALCNHVLEITERAAAQSQSTPSHRGIAKEIRGLAALLDASPLDKLEGCALTKVKLHVEGINLYRYPVSYSNDDLRLFLAVEYISGHFKNLPKI